MGYGDEIMATGLARGLRDKGKLAAFGDGKKIVWGPWSEEMFRNNPNIAHPSMAHQSNLIWIPHYKGARLYNVQSFDKTKWIWNYDFRAKPGEFFFDQWERLKIDALKKSYNDFVVIEPNVPWQKTVAPNKDWGEQKYRQLCRRLRDQGISVVQFVHKNTRRRLDGVATQELKNFRDVIGALSLAKLYIGPEGGMHHASAAVGIDAVVLMGGFIPPLVVGYAGHANFTGGAKACGSIQPCSHCVEAMSRISVDEVFEAAMAKLQ